MRFDGVFECLREMSTVDFNNLVNVSIVATRNVNTRGNRKQTVWKKLHLFCKYVSGFISILTESSWQVTTN